MRLSPWVTKISELAEIMNVQYSVMEAEFNKKFSHFDYEEVQHFDGDEPKDSKGHYGNAWMTLKVAEEVLSAFQDSEQIAARIRFLSELRVRTQKQLVSSVINNQLH